MKPLLVTFVSVAALAGCQAPRPFNASRSEAKLREMIDARVPPGADPAQVQAALAELRVDPIDQVLTEEPSGSTLRAWVWEPGGPWPPEGREDFLKWVEVYFRFDTARRLEGYDITKHAILGMSMRFPLDPRHDPQVRAQPPSP